MKPRLISAFVLALTPVLAGPLRAQGAGRITFPDSGHPVFGWQNDVIANPKGGEAFAASAFIHPLSTPGGFVCTAIQPDDHLHHLGIWWPWKFVEVDGRKYVTWEMQMGEGAHQARSVKEISRTADRAEWEMMNEAIIKPKDAEPRTVIREIAHVVLSRRPDATVLDVDLSQKPLVEGVRIARYHYSGFSWRGPEAWNKDNCTMLTSEGKGRDDSNGTPARWVVVTGPTPKGSASVLILNHAEKLCGTPEKLRVWDSKNHNGTPFVNFNPVSDKTLPLDDATPAVARRSYRVIAVDRTLAAADAEAEWKKWTSR